MQPVTPAKTTTDLKLAAPSIGGVALMGVMARRILNRTRVIERMPYAIAIFNT